ncbi:hypothetical protein PM082_015460 [Marasmius tenuissimus]|nr:hypothetical protein PM082_015460 [Marasmius tenuissimus]
MLINKPLLQNVSTLTSIFILVVDPGTLAEIYSGSICPPTTPTPTPTPMEAQLARAQLERKQKRKAERNSQILRYRSETSAVRQEKKKQGMVRLLWLNLKVVFEVQYSSPLFSSILKLERGILKQRLPACLTRAGKRIALWSPLAFLVFPPWELPLLRPSVSANGPTNLALRLCLEDCHRSRSKSARTQPSLSSIPITSPRLSFSAGKHMPTFHRPNQSHCCCQFFPPSPFSQSTSHDSVATYIFEHSGAKEGGWFIAGATGSNEPVARHFGFSRRIHRFLAASLPSRTENAPARCHDSKLPVRSDSTAYFSQHLAHGWHPPTLRSLATGADLDAGGDRASWLIFGHRNLAPWILDSTTRCTRFTALEMKAGADERQGSGRWDIVRGRFLDNMEGELEGSISSAWEQFRHQYPYLLMMAGPLIRIQEDPRIVDHPPQL